MNKTLVTVIALTIGSFALCMGITLVGAFLSDSGKRASAAKPVVDLEKLTKEFEAFASTKKDEDFEGFEKILNDPAKKIYQGKDRVDVEYQNTGALIGFVDKNANNTYEVSSDDQVFTLQADHNTKEVVASDREERYYRHRSSSGFFTGYLIGSMLTRQRTYYRGSYWRAPSSAHYVKSGYYSKPSSWSRSSSSSRNRSSRWGSSGTRRSSSRSGGFSFGK